MSNKRINLSSRNIQLILISCLLVLMGFYIVSTTLFFPSTFEDDRYNLGVALRSASPEAKSLLETSLAHWYFKFYPTPRPEDWHRGLSVLALSFWARLTGSNSILMRIPHLLWVSIWLSMACLLCLQLIRSSANKFSISKQTWMLLFLIAFLTINATGLLILNNAYLDDVPAASLILIALFILLRVSKVTMRVAVVAGTLCGLAFFVKNFYVIWGPIGVLFVAYLNMTDWKIARLVKTFKLITLFTLAFFIVIIPKFLWNWHDSGEFLESSAPCAITVGIHLSSDLDGYPFFLHQQQSCDKLVIPAKYADINPAQQNASTYILGDVVAGIRFLAYVWLWLPFIILARKHFRNSIALKMLACVALCVIVYQVAFLIGFGTSQTRYWIVPITLITIAGVYALYALYPLKGRWKQRGLFFSALLIFAVSWTPIDQIAYSFYIIPLTEYPSLTDQLAANLPREQSVMLQTPEAIYYWSLHPIDRVVSLNYQYIDTLEQADLRRFMDAYNVQWALYTAPAASRLEQLGFVEVSRGGGYRLLHRQPEPDNPAIF